MKLFSKIILLTAALSMGQVYAKSCGNGQIKFAKGKSETTVKGSVKKREYCEYTFYAKKGQKLTVNLGNNKPYAVLRSPVNTILANEQSFVLPRSGRYVLRVLLTRNDARKYSSAQPFAMKFKIK